MRQGLDRVVMWISIASLSSLTALAAASCGGGTGGDGGDSSSYPPEVPVLTIALQASYQLTLDGQGTRCEQLVRALVDPRQRPPELAPLDTVGATTRCIHDGLLNRDIVDLSLPLYAGRPLVPVVQSVVAHVDANNQVVVLNGSLLTPGRAPGNSGRDTAAIRASVPGRGMTYGRFESCQYLGQATYSIAGDDQIEVGDDSYFLDGDSRLHRVRPVDVYLIAGHLTTEIINSDSFCCVTESLEHCIGQKLIIDVVTGELLGELQHCITC
jgi:hypothetical protein